MKPYLVFLGLGTSGAGIASLVSYGVKATDFSESAESLLEYEINSLQTKERTTEEDEKLKKLLEEQARIAAEKLRRELETIKEKIERLIQKIKNIFKKHFFKSENKDFLDELKSNWTYLLDNINDSEFDSKLIQKKIALSDILKTLNEDEKFSEMYKNMKELLDLWKDLKSKTNDYEDLLGKFHKLFHVNNFSKID